MSHNRYVTPLGSRIFSHACVTHSSLEVNNALITQIDGFKSFSRVPVFDIEKTTRMVDNHKKQTGNVKTVRRALNRMTQPGLAPKQLIKVDY